VIRSILITYPTFEENARDPRFEQPPLYGGGFYYSNRLTFGAVSPGAYTALTWGSEGRL
jgi:hypothetical protein